jgi:hypothetical protein
MNNAQRKEIADITAELQNLASRLEPLAEEERAKYDNLSEGLQQSERGSAIAEAANQLEEALEFIQQAESSLESL